MRVWVLDGLSRVRSLGELVTFGGPFWQTGRGHGSLGGGVNLVQGRRVGRGTEKEVSSLRPVVHILHTPVIGSSKSLLISSNQGEGLCDTEHLQRVCIHRPHICTQPPSP